MHVSMLCSIIVILYHGRSDVVQELLTSKADLDHQDQVSVRACVCVLRGIESIGEHITV